MLPGTSWPRDSVDDAHLTSSWVAPAEPASPPNISFVPHVTSTFIDPGSCTEASSKSSLFPGPSTPEPSSRRRTRLIPRPPNSFILFRSSFMKNQNISTEARTNHSTLSKIVGLAWKNMPHDEREVWEAKAKQALEEHRKKWPEYTFRPYRVMGKGGTEKRKDREVEPKDMKRCAKIAEFLVEGKKGVELDAAIQESDRTHVPEIKTQHAVLFALFTKDGKEVLSGGLEGKLRRWRVDGGQAIGEPIQTEFAEIGVATLSPDCKWLVCGLRRSARNVVVWDVQTRRKALDITGHTNAIFSADISPNSMKFATGGSEIPAAVFIWSMTTGERLVGPLEHDSWIVAVRFSPNGDRIATAATAKNPVDTNLKSIRIYNSENGQRLFDIESFQFHNILSSPLSWSAGGRQLFAASSGEVQCFDTSSGNLLHGWSVPGGVRFMCSNSIALARNQKFIVIVAFKSLSFWDASTYTQIGTVIQHANPVCAIALSPNDDSIVTGEHDGKITIRSLRDILPSSYFMLDVNLPFMCLGDEQFKSWMRGDLIRVEKILTQDIIHSPDALLHAHALAYRALVRIRLKQWNTAFDDAKESIKIQWSIIGNIAHSITLIANGEYASGMDVFDIVFADGPHTENNFLMLVKAVILFECGEYGDAISRVSHLIDTVDDHQMLYITVRAQMYLLLGIMSMKRGYNECAIYLFKRTQEAVPFRHSPYLVVISLIFGYDFDRFAPSIQLHLLKAVHAVGCSGSEGLLFTIAEAFGEVVLTRTLTVDWDPDLVQKCLRTFENNGDIAAGANDHKQAIIQYSAALSLNPSNSANLLVKRSHARTVLGLCEDALKDADCAIMEDPSSPLGFQKRHLALHCLRRYDEAINAFARMLSLIDSSHDPDIRSLGKQYISPSKSETIIISVIRRVLKTTPLVLIDVKSGRLCNEEERLDIFKSEPQFKELVSSMAKQLDHRHIERVVEEYFRYVMLSHVWQGKEPSFQDVILAGSVWKLDSKPLNEKLRKFCEVVRREGYRWAWSDTCCIDKTISTVLNQSLKMMYRWYEASATTFVLLVDVTSPSSLGHLSGSIWMTRAWTSQELLAPTQIRFYTGDWQPYLGDMGSNHKESPRIIRELANAIGIARETIVTFKPDDLTVRQKLRLASRRNATLEEDIAYSLIGIFKSDIRPDYGEGDAALGHLLEEIVARSGDVGVLEWTGKSSSYNSCLPATLLVYSQSSHSAPPFGIAQKNAATASLRESLPPKEAIMLRDRIVRLPPPRFANRRLHLPCIIFTVRWLGVQDLENTPEKRYRAKVSFIGKVEFQTSDELWLTEARDLIFVHPWIRELRGPHQGFDQSSSSTSDSDTGSGFNSTSSLQDLTVERDRPRRSAKPDGHTRALELIVRLKRPFHALLLRQQPHGEFKRVATEHEIILPGITQSIEQATDVRTEVVEIL